MKTIWKFPLKAQICQKVAMPEGAEVLTIQVQGRTPCLWAIVDDKAPKVDRHFLTYGTGHRMDIAHDKYIGTFQLLDGGLVFHVFETSKETALKEITNASERC
jgi:hypothetical protein